MAYVRSQELKESMHEGFNRVSEEADLGLGESQRDSELKRGYCTAGIDGIT
jgi:hypothetical protein